MRRHTGHPSGQSASKIRTHDTGAPQGSVQVDELALGAEIAWLRIHDDHHIPQSDAIPSALDDDRPPLHGIVAHAAEALTDTKINFRAGWNKHKKSRRGIFNVTLMYSTPDR